MPLYEYHCNACGADTEILHKISDPVPKKCPDCGKSKLVRHVSAAGFRLSGGGWYETDFKSGSDKKRNLVDKGAGDKSEAPAAAPAASSDKPAAKSEAKTPAKSESKPEAKSEAKKPAGKSAKPKASS